MHHYRASPTCNWGLGALWSFPVGMAPSMPTADEYLRKGEECLAAAGRAQDPVERAMLMQLYEQWLRLAHYKWGKDGRQDPKNSN